MSHPEYRLKEELLSIRIEAAEIAGEMARQIYVSEKPGPESAGRVNSLLSRSMGVYRRVADYEERCGGSMSAYDRRLVLQDMDDMKHITGVLAKKVAASDGSL